MNNYPKKEQEKRQRVLEDEQGRLFVVSASITVYLYIDENSSEWILTMNEMDYHNKLYCNFLGGKVDPGETFRDAAYREALEETNHFSTALMPYGESIGLYASDSKAYIEIVYVKNKIDTSLLGDRELHTGVERVFYWKKLSELVPFDKNNEIQLHHRIKHVVQALLGKYIREPNLFYLGNVNNLKDLGLADHETKNRLKNVLINGRPRVCKYYVKKCLNKQCKFMHTSQVFDKEVGEEIYNKLMEIKKELPPNDIYENIVKFGNETLERTLTWRYYQSPNFTLL